MTEIILKSYRTLYKTMCLLVTLLVASLAAAQTAEEKIWKEDPERVKFFWKMRMSPTKYMRALKNTGQLELLEAPQKLQETMIDVQTQWRPIGPTGDFGTDESIFLFKRNGRIRSIQVLPAAGGDYDIYLGASSGGLWRARGSAGPVWEDLGRRLPNPAVGAFAVNPDDTEDILVGTGDWNRYGGAGLFRTRNEGLTWNEITLPDNPGAFFQIQYLPENPNIVLVATTQGLMRSQNGPGGPWTVRLKGTVSDLVIHPTNPEIQYCSRMTRGGFEGGLYESTDAGQTWNRVTSTGAPTNAVAHGRIAICRDVPNTIVYAYEWGGVIINQPGQVQGGVKRSTDGGNTWTDITGTIVLGQAFHALAAAIRPDDPTEIMVGANNMFRSTDGGSAWQAIVAGHQDQTQLYFHPSTGDAEMWICNDGGIYRLTLDSNIDLSDLEAWNGNETTGLQVSQIYQLDAARDSRVIAMQDNGIAGSINNGANWKGFDNNDGMEVEITDDLDLTFWLSLGVFAPPPWRVFKQPFDGSKQSVSASQSHIRLFFDRFSNKIYSVDADDSPRRLVSSPNSGMLSWSEELVVPDKPCCMTGSYVDGNTLYVWYPSSCKLVVLQKSGSTWGFRTETLSTISGNKIESVYASTERPEKSWATLTGAAGDPKVLHTRDAWESWEDISGSLVDVKNVWALVVRPFNSNEIYAATNVGVFQTQDGGTTWQPFQTGLPIVSSTDIRYIVDRTRNGNDKLVVSTFGRGVYERTLTRPPLVYVDPRNSGFEDGTFTHPFNTFDEGFDATPDQGVLGLNGNVYTVPTTLSKPIIIEAYESTAQLRR